MYTLIIVSIVFGILVVKISYSFWQDYNYSSKVTFLSVFTDVLRIIGRSLIAFIVSVIITVIIGRFIPNISEIHIRESFDIVNLQDNNSVSGDFFLGCGSVDGEMKYTFFYKTSGGFKIKQIKSEGVEIKYSDTPKVVYYGFKLTDAPINNWTLSTYKEPYYEIYIPSGSIKNNYNLDAR